LLLFAFQTLRLIHPASSKFMGYRAIRCVVPPTAGYLYKDGGSNLYTLRAGARRAEVSAATASPVVNHNGTLSPELPRRAS